MAHTSRRDKLANAALSLFAKRGYAETTVGEIEAAAGLSARAGGFYRHFESKEDVLLKAMEGLVEGLVAELRVGEITSLGSIRAELLVIARTLIRAAEEQRPLRLLLQREGPRLPALRKAARKANAKLASTDVLPWVKSALARSGRKSKDPQATAMIIFAPVIVYFIGRDRGDAAFGIGNAEAFLQPWADHWAEWFAAAHVHRRQSYRGRPSARTAV
jgi:AcrR family transcriptional regulator